MSDQMTPELETRLQAWLAMRAPADVPTAFFERVATIPRTPESVPTSRPGRLRDARRRIRPMLLAAATISVVIVVLAGGLFVAASKRDAIVPLTSPSPTGSATPAPSPTPAPTASEAPGVISSNVLPATIPADVSHGVVDTPFGAARWVHLGGGGTPPLDPRQIIRMPNGQLAWFVGGGPGVACANDPASITCTDPPKPSLSVSNDVLAPRVARDLPIDAAQADLRLIDDTFWLITTDPQTIWRSSDLEGWQRTDISGLQSPGPAGLAWKIAVSPQAKAAGSTIAYVTFTALDTGSLLGYPGVDVHLSKTESGDFLARQYRLRSAGGDIDLGPIMVKESPDGLHFLDAKGVEVGHVDGVDREFAESWAQRGEIRYDRLAASDGGPWSMVELPGAEPADWVTIVPMGAKRLAFVVEPDQKVRGWQTVDGRSWTGGQTLVAPDGRPMLSGGVTYRETDGDPIILVTGVDGGPGWRSTDGERWTVDTVDPNQLPVVRVGQGWIRTADQTEDNTWQVSRDGTTWEPVPALQGIVTKIAPEGPGGSTEFAVDDTLFFAVEEGDVISDVWMIEFEPPRP